MMQSLRKACLLCLAVVCTCLVQAQYTRANDDPDADFKLAKELYQKEQFSLAYPLFKNLYSGQNSNSSIPVSIQSEAKFYAVICGLTLKDETAEQAAIEYIELEHNEPMTEMMCFHLAEYYYSMKNFPEAAEYYERAVVDNLSNSQIGAMKFHLAYAYFTMQRLNDAKPLFDAIRQIPGDPNYADANYYYGFILFGEKKYTEALNCFKIAESKPDYAGIVPYYISEIYYFTGQKDKALETAETALKKGGQYYDLQLKQIIGHILFEKKNFSKALPYIEAYVTNTEKVSREDLYELSYCYYQARQYSKAVSGFKELGGKQDSLAQNSMYLLADAYLKLGQKPGARSAFLFCSLNSSNPTQKEISKFHYAKLSWELGYPDVALNELKEFVSVYPKSEFAGEAKELLVNVLANSSNYREAMELVNAMPSRSETVKRIYPKILYGRSVELVNDQQLLQAESLLNELVASPYNADQLPYAYFWKGEIAYRKGDFDSAVHYLSTYMRTPVSYGEVNPKNARYTLGYSNLRQEDYAAALKYFEQITTTVSASTAPVDADAFLRSADCYFMQKKYSKAQQMYDQVIAGNLQGADYALFQKAIIAGAGGQYNQKITLLQSVAAKYPSSVMVPDANMEVANTWLANEKYDAAITPLKQILNNKAAEPLKPQAYLKLGVAYVNLGNNTEALNNFKQLISGYPNSEESNEAVDYVRNIFVDNQQPAEFVTFMRQNGKDISFSEEDSLSYASANIAYSNRSFDKAQAALAAYLKQFPDGRYAVDANYQMGEIYTGKKDYARALQHYTYVADKAPNKYAEAAVLQAARISYFDQKDYTSAQHYFLQLKAIAVTPENKLESMRGLLRCQYKLAQWKDAVPNAQELLDQKGIATDDKMMANMVIAKNYQNNNDLFEASAAYKTVVALGKSEYAAEARYRIAEILFLQQKLAESEKAAFEVINKAGSYDYWITKAYILLGDVYFKQQDYFNAEATLKSVVDNATNPELQKEAQKKLDAVVAEKNRNSKIEG